MKKNVLKALALSLVLMLVMSTVAFAADGTYAPPSSGKIVATITGVGAGDYVSLLVVTAGTELETLEASAIKFIDQKTADGTGTVSFDFGELTGEFDIYSGYTSMTTDDPIKLKLMASDVLLGDVNGDGAIDSTDASLILQYFTHNITTFEYADALTAADVNNDSSVDSTDASLILQYFTHNISEFPKVD